jgi:hypothetical protein
MAHGTGATAGYGIRYPLGTDPVDINQYIADIASDVETALQAVYTDAQITALAGGALWAGRRVYNSTYSKYYVYVGGRWMPEDNLVIHPFLNMGV